MSEKVAPIPEGRHAITPYLVVNGATEAIKFYEKAFNAECISRHDMGDKIMHAELKIGDSVLMVSDEFPENDCGVSAPGTLKRTTVMLHLYVEDVDSTFAQVVKAGATAQMPVSDTFWGDRYGQLVDPFGHVWSIATRKENLTEEQIMERAAQFFAGQH